MSTRNCNIIHLSEVDSTNTYVKNLLLDEQPPEGTVFVTGHQTAGKGQDTNSWESEFGKNILATIIFYPVFLDVSDQFRMSMVVACGICDYLHEILPAEEISIKWPNDIYVGKKKIGGILINNEVMGRQFKYVIAGIGLNVNQLDFSHDIPNPVSMSLLGGNVYDLEIETRNLFDYICKRYSQLNEDSFDLIKRDYYARLLGLHEWRSYEYEGGKISARITGVNEYGKLLLDTESGKIECDLKEIAFLF